MEAKLTFKYDRQGDILYINKTPPYPEQESVALLLTKAKISERAQFLAELFGGREYRFLAGLKKWSSVSHKLLEW